MECLECPMNLEKFLHAHKVTKGSAYTHTSFVGGIYNVPDDDLSDFYALYKIELINARPMYITEKHQAVSPIVIDLDFRQDKAHRIYTIDMIKTFCTHISRYAREYIELPDTITCYLMEKTSPRKHKESNFKDGIHIEFPEIVTHPAIQHKIRERFIDEQPTFFSSFLNILEEIYDEAVIERNNWFLYGSTKPEEPLMYWIASNKLTISADNKVVKTDAVKGNNTNLVELLSIRNKTVKHPYTEFGDDAIKALSRPRPTRIHDDGDESTEASQAITSLYSLTLPDNKTLATQLVDLLSNKRANNYEDWMRVGWCLHNIDKTLLDKWVEFSKRSAKYVAGECLQLWSSMKDHGLMMGSLVKWAREDSPEEFEAVYATMKNKLMLECQRGHPADLAKLIHMFYKDRFICSAIKTNTWYEFKDHRYVNIDTAYTLRQVCSQNLADIFLSESIKCMNMANKGDDEQHARYKSRSLGCQKVYALLKKPNFKDQVIRECAEIFYDPSYVAKFDTRRDLVGFTNGVYDLEKQCFRAGEPEDYLTMTTGYPFAIEDDAEVQADIMRFIRSIMPNDKMADYLMTVTAYMLHGHKYLEYLWFFTGNGRNGKSCYAALLKNAFGDYYYEPDISIVTQTNKNAGGATPHLAKSIGKRLLVSSEPDDEDSQAKFKVNKLKQMRGNDMIQTRGLYQNCIEFRPQFGMIFLMNDIPELNKVDDAISRSLKVVRFPYQFVPNPQLENERNVDYNLKSKFDNDLRYHQQFMRLLIKQYRKYVHGSKKVDDPPEVIAETRSYVQDNNPVIAWLKEHYDITNLSEHRYSVDDFLQAFLDDTNERVTKKKFGQLMSMTGMKSKAVHGTRYYTGVKRIVKQPIDLIVDEED